MIEYLSDWEITLGESVLKKARSHYDTGISPAAAGAMLGLTEKEILKIWYPTGTILEPFAVVLAKKRFKKTSGKPLPNLNSKKMTDIETLNLIKQYFLSGFTEAEIVKIVSESQNKVIKCKAIIAKSLGGKASFNEICSKAVLERALEIYSFLKEFDSVNLTLSKYNISERKLGRMKALAERHLGERLNEA